MRLETLKSTNNWLCWKYILVKNSKGEERLTKPPYSAFDGGGVGTTEEYRSRWGTHIQAHANCRTNKKSFDGVGFVFDKVTDTLSICGIDIDHQDLNSDFVKSTISMFPNAYIEKSPSGDGIHLVFLVDVSKIPQKDGKLDTKYYVKNDKAGIEAYVAGLTNRYFTFTEDTIQNGNDVDQTAEFLQFLDMYMVRKTAKKATTTTESSPKNNITLSDNDLLQKARNAANGAKFSALYDRGDISGYESQSSADLALMNMLAFWTQKNASQMEQLFSQSALGQRDKWQRSGYRQMTVDRAIADCGEVYEPNKKATPGADFADASALTIWSLPVVDVTAMSAITMSNPKTRKFSIAVCRLFLQAFGIKIRINDMNRRAEITGLPKEYDGEDACNLLEILVSDAANGLAFKRASTQNIHDCLAVIASENRYHPVVELINSEPWDGVDRLQEVYSMLGLTDDFHKTLLRKWALQTIAVLYNTGDNPIAAQGILVLQGSQGIGKTEFFSHLAIKKDFFKDGAQLDMTNKDLIMSAVKVWLCELGELDSTTKKEQSSLKAFLTAQTDRFREPYARCEVVRPRRTSFCGTVNPKEYLRDETGNRRYWTIPVDKIDLKKVFGYSPQWYTQFWRQAHAGYIHNPKGYLLTKEEQDRVNGNNTAFEAGIYGEDEFISAFDMDADARAWSWLSASQIAEILNEKFKSLSIRSENIGGRLLPRIERRFDITFNRKIVRGRRLIQCPPKLVTDFNGGDEDDDFLAAEPLNGERVQANI